MDNNVSATLSQEDIDAVMAAIETIRSRMPFLLSLSTDERRSMAKLGDKSRAFVDRAAEVANQYSDLLPRSFDLQEMKRDVELFEQLQSIQLALRSLSEQVESTTFAAGADAYAAALVVYQAVRYQGKGTELEAVVDDLARRFARKS